MSDQFAPVAAVEVRRRSYLYGSSAVVAAIIFAVGLQSLIVFYRFDGNWTGWFCTGSNFSVPPQLASEHLYVFPSSPGYHGQMYHYLAHDPFLRSNLREYMDDPRFRCRRFLVPFLAWLLSAGHPGYIDLALLVVNLCFLLLGTWSLGQYCVLSGTPPAASASFALVPALLV